MKNNKFEFWCPLDISKGKDDSGKEVMKLGGIASTADKDSDEEFLDPSGFNIDEFKKSGVINWHHGTKKSAATIIGEPSKAEIRDDGFYVETVLYPSSELAKEVYQLAQTLEKDSKTRRLGYSIEGSVDERGSNDEKHPDYKKIKKATITGLAITHMPKNPKTFADIIKGNVDEEDEEEDNVKKSTNTENAAPLKKESLEGVKYVIKAMTNDERMLNIFKTYSGITIEKAEKVNYLLNQIQNKMSKMEKLISNEDIEKALSSIGLDPKENPFIETIEKGKDKKDMMTPEEIAAAVTKKTTGDDEEEEDKKPSKKKMEKAKSQDEEEQDEEDEEEEDEKPVKKAIKKAKKDEEEEPKNKMEMNKFKKSPMKKDMDEDEEDENEDDVKKSKNSDVLAAINSIAEKQKTDTKSLGTLIKAQLDTINEINNKLIDTQTELKKANDKIEELSGQSQGRKSITKGFVDRQFDKGEDENKNSNSNVLSKSRDSKAILNILDRETTSKGHYDEEFGNATMSFESSKTITANVLSRLKLEKNIVIVD